MLEDDFTYVLRKALKGNALAPAEAAQRADLPPTTVLAFSRGKFDEEIARRLAPVLGLKADAMANHDRYHPAPLALPGVHRLDLPFHDERVNAWLVRGEGTAVLFDTGFEPRTCHAALRDLGEPDEIFITHTHADHIGGNADFPGVTIHGDAVTGGRSMHPGDVFKIGPLAIRACDLSGHATPALGYLIDGLAKPVLVTGDALFAGSMGGCDGPAVYQHALLRLHAVLDPLPDDTVLLPGHGPATTLGEERSGNPFL
jgi:hydroxyacylglutathione hydrolase